EGFIMNVLIIGANGQIGRHLVRKLQESNKHNAIAMVRSDEQKAAFEEQGVQAVLADLEGSIDEISRVAEGAMQLYLLQARGAIQERIKR
ncbi:NAD(P)H-binding protein, partial [Paenibacillus sp. AR247]|uniref:NAD(P)H-binding protein n=1 Tax=Paenibacillus sp. AR247 TaxID=1631599 RepID=UPI00280C3DD1